MREGEEKEEEKELKVREGEEKEKNRREKKIVVKTGRGEEETVLSVFE